MATTQYHRFSYSAASGAELAPGANHNWWLTHGAYRDVALVDVQVNVTAHPWVFLPHYRAFLPSELSVSNVRSRVSEDGLVMYFTVTNSGPNPVPYYGIGVSFIDE